MAVSTPRAIPVEPPKVPSNGAILPLENGDRLTRAEFADGILRSAVFPGLWLDPAALIRGDVNGVYAVVR